MIFLGYEKLSAQKALVYLRNYSPETLPQDVLDGGVLVEFIPEPLEQKDKVAALYINPETKELYYEYTNAPKESTSLELEIEELKQENQLLKAQNNALSERADFIEEVVAEMAVQVYQ